MPHPFSCRVFLHRCCKFLQHLACIICAHGFTRVMIQLRYAATDAARHDHSKVDDDVEDSPLLAMFQQEERRHQQTGGTAGGMKKDVPHLSFEITSDDGFRVESDSLTRK